MTDPVSPSTFEVEERDGWVRIRARSAIWSWITIEEAIAIGRAWLERYDEKAPCSVD